MRFADADLVAAIVKPSDHLKKRAEAALREGGVDVPFSVGIELLFVAEKHGIPYVDFLGAAARRFAMDGAEILFTAAEALDQGDVGTVFDAVHAATAFHANTELVTTDRRLHKSPFPTRAF